MSIAFLCEGVSCGKLGMSTCLVKNRFKLFQRHLAQQPSCLHYMWLIRLGYSYPKWGFSHLATLLVFGSRLIMYISSKKKFFLKLKKRSTTTDVCDCGIIANSVYLKQFLFPYKTVK